MKTSFFLLMAALAKAVIAAPASTDPLPAVAAEALPAAQAGITPHEQYSSSVGVLGCKIDTNRVAYWPQPVDCNNICVKVSYQGRSLNLLRIDQSGGAYDISCDAWNYLSTGFSATDRPTTGGAVTMDIENVPADNCRHLLRGGGSGSRLAFSGPNSMNFISSCVAGQPGSWVAGNYQLFNIKDSGCHCGWDEACSLNLAVSNQPACPHQLGTSGPVLPDTVFNIQYGTGASVPDPRPVAC